MWYWCDSFLAGWWWVFPVMAVLCFFLMFFFMKRFFMGRLSCCGTASISGGPQSGRGNSKTGTDGSARPEASRFAESMTGG